MPGQMNPRQSNREKLLRQTEPYAFQRGRDSIHSAYPRPPQPSIQPNQKPRLSGWGLNSRDYWDSLFSDYLKGRR